MMHSIPPEYSHDAKLITLYNTGYKDGYYANRLNHSILDENQILTDAERLCYANGKRAGELKKKKEMEHENP